MGDITSINDNYLLTVCNTASVSALDLLSQYEFNSHQWLLHTSGLAYGIWISLCDPIEISLDEIDELINEMVISHLN